MTKCNSIIKKLKRTIKRMSQHSKECCNKVEELEVENSVTIKERCVAKKDGNERLEDCHDIV